MAKQIFEKVLAKSGDNADAKNYLSMYYRLKGDLDTAEKYIKEVLLLQPRNVLALNNLGIIYLLRKEYHMALWVFGNKVLDYEKNNSEALNNLGLTYVALGNIPMGVENFEKAIEANPENYAARLNLGSIYLNYLHYQAAFEQYEKIVGAQPDNAEALIGLASSTWGLGDGKKAAELYTKALEKDPKRVILLYRLGTMYETVLNDMKTALDYYKKYIAVAKLSKDDVLYQKIAQMQEIIDKGGLQLPPEEKPDEKADKEKKPETESKPSEDKMEKESEKKLEPESKDSTKDNSPKNVK